MKIINRYGTFFQEGGMMPQETMPVDQMMAQDSAMQQQAAPDPQAIAQEFLTQFQQLPPEAQQLIAQAIMEMAQTQ